MKFLAARIRNMHFQVGVIDRKVVFLQGFENLVAHILTIFENPRTPEAESELMESIDGLNAFAESEEFQMAFRFQL
ncbi:Protein CBG27970 [Caenorhabditis briggsae]|uniref:Protein CBG27970 n=1 Tax=Caenorhabditis briggsae TaxID=6238 RepID=B6IJR2_CAEBR|nr:Protein CBG27970 [Caenorhabditis briggsae]CAS00142.1 Protein CBG27970 [Caenorhabditis briggsae]